MIQKKLIDWKQLEEALNEQKSTREFVGEVLVRKQYIPRFLLFKALAERHSIPFVDLSHIFIDPGAVGKVPESVARQYGVMPIEVQGSTLVVGISDPVATVPLGELAALARVGSVKAVLCTPEAVNKAISEHYGESKNGVLK